MASDGTLAGRRAAAGAAQRQVIIEQDGRREQGYAGGGGRFAYTRIPRRPSAGGAGAAKPCAGAGQSRSGAGAGRHDDRRARPGLARRAAARGHRPRPRRRLQPQGHLGVQRPHRRSTWRPTACTVVDDGTLAGRRGSLNVDDEGTPTQCTTLIENGVLRGYMQDKLNARLMGVQPTGNGRRESFAHADRCRA